MFYLKCSLTTVYFKLYIANLMSKSSSGISSQVGQEPNTSSPSILSISCSLLVEASVFTISSVFVFGFSLVKSSSDDSHGSELHSLAI